MKRWVYFGVFVVLGLLGCSFPASAQIEEQVSVPGTEYDPGDPTNQNFVPRVNNFQASPGETLIFNVLEEKDRKRPIGAPDWTVFEGIGPYKVKFTCSNDARLGAAIGGTTVRTLILTGVLNTQNVQLHIRNNWTGANPIPVVAAITDNVPAKIPPDIGSAKDPDSNVSWSIIKRTGLCPTSLTRVSEIGPVWTPAPALYTYEGDPDRLPPGRPDYEGQSVTEFFSPPTALGFTMDDVTLQFQLDHPSLNTPNRVAVFLFSSGTNATFIFNNMDRISDLHDGFGDTTAFKPSAFTDADGVGYNLTQKYKCGPPGPSQVIGTAVISRRMIGNTLQIMKTDP